MHTPERISQEQLRRYVLVVEEVYIDDHGDSDYRKETTMLYRALKPDQCIFEGDTLTAYRYQGAELPIPKDRTPTNVCESTDFLSPYHSIEERVRAYVDTVCPDGCYYAGGELVYCSPWTEGCCAPREKFHRIAGYAFTGCTRITQVTLPECVTYIDRWSFSGCTALESINIPAAVWHLGFDAFEGCVNLKHVDLRRNPKIPLDRFKGTPFYDALPSSAK